MAVGAHQFALPRRPRSTKSNLGSAEPLLNLGIFGITVGDFGRACRLFLGNGCAERRSPMAKMARNGASFTIAWRARRETALAGWGCSQIRTRLCGKFPFIRENNGNFGRSVLYRILRVSKSLCAHRVLPKFPVKSNREFLVANREILDEPTGKFS